MNLFLAAVEPQEEFRQPCIEALRVKRMLVSLILLIVALSHDYGKVFQSDAGFVAAGIRLDDIFRETRIGGMHG